MALLIFGAGLEAVLHVIEYINPDPVAPFPPLQKP